MAHEVSLEIANKVVFHKDVTFEVKKDRKKLGKLLISKGNIEWLPAGNSVNRYRLTWENFADLMVKNGKKVQVRQKVSNNAMGPMPMMVTDHARL